LLSALLYLATAHAHPGEVDAQGCHIDGKTDRRHCHPQRKRVAKPRFDAQHPPKAGDEGVFYGPLVSVTDGDTLKVKVQGVVMDFRLAEVDAPEKDQPHGAQSRDELTRLLRASPQIVLEPKDTDRYGRTVAQVWVGSTNINRAMVERGAVWFYAEYAKDDTFYQLEQDARRAKRGLWALPLAQRMEPWVWRKQKRER
jgi:endonuclease YncB( thermonuclease family)